VIDVERDFERMRDYVGDRLADDERRAFEDRLARDPELVREFEQTLRLREGLERLKEQGYFARPARRTALRLLMWVPALAAAAIAALAVILWVQPQSTSPGVLRAALESRAAPGPAPAVSAHFTFVSMRGSSSYDLDRPAAGLIEFRASPVGHAAGARYRLTLVRVGQAGAPEPIGTLVDLLPDADGYLHGYATASALTAGRYLLRVEPMGQTTGAALAFPFELHDR
jgi:anti-sigma factor RsiW